MMLKRRSTLFAITAVILPVFILAFIVLPKGQEKSLESGGHNQASCEGLELRGSCYPLQLADTNQARLKGLSGRDSLPDNTGMLFVFETPAEQCFWMKDMRFEIDIIWTNEAKQIIKIEKAVSPDSYPKSFCAEATKYVLEFDGGFTEDHGLKAGTRLKF